ncbi:MAG: methionyl-tRNA formyltransferase [bacterium]|nr:methionyl-tRNA formyltransferase [bacterium]
MQEKIKICIATIKTWNFVNLAKFINNYSDVYDIYVCKLEKELSYQFLKSINPDYIFFPHWSWIIDKDIYENFKCVLFHITDLPYGRGGSPLQNLILKGKKKTKISAIKVSKDLDAGDIYSKDSLCIDKESAQEIFQKVSDIIFFKMIPNIIRNNTCPKPQKGIVTFFKRRTPEQSNILNAELKNMAQFYDFIRMLDAESYPKAFIKYKNFTIEFNKAEIKNNEINGRFRIIEE